MPRLSTLALLFVTLGLAPVARADDPPAAPAGAAPPARATVVRVYDGDTFTLANGDRVRLRWVNTTELRPKEAFGEEAREAAAAFIMGKEVDLRYGPVVRDGYGRLVADVIVDGRSLEEELLRKGLAHLFILPPVDGDLEPLFEAQAAAKAAMLGIWTDIHFRGPLHITSFHANGRGDERKDPNAEYFRVCNISDDPVSLAGWRVVNAKGQSFTLPDVSIPAGHTVQVHSGVGEHQADPNEQIKVHLMSRVPVWNNKADKLTLFDPQGQVVDFREHRVKDAD